MTLQRPGREAIPKDQRRQSFNCRLSPETAEYIAKLPGSNGQKIDNLVAALLNIERIVKTITLAHER